MNFRNHVWWEYTTTVLIQTVQFTIHLPFYLTHRQGPIRCYHSGSEWTWEQRQWRDALHSPKLQHHWNFTIRLFSVIYQDTHWGWGLTLCRGTVGVIYSPSRLGNANWKVKPSEITENNVMCTKKQVRVKNSLVMSKKLVFNSDPPLKKAMNATWFPITEKFWALRTI